MLLYNEQKELVEKFIKANPKYIGNEDLFDDFCNETLQKSYIIFNSASSIQKIESYIAKVVNTSITSVLKNSGRIRKTSTGYISTKEVSIDTVQNPINSSYQDKQIVSDGFLEYDYPDPRETVEEIIIKKDLLQRIADAVCVIHKEEPELCYLDIFYLRYMKNYKQSEIAESLNLSQSEISKRLMQLSKLISAYLYP